MKHIYLYLLLALLGLSACNRRVSDYADGMAVYERNGKFGYLDSTGRVAIPARYEVAKDFHDGMAYVSEGGKWGYIDKKGTVVIPIEYDYIYGYVWEYGLEYAVVEQNGKRGYISRTGELKVNPEYDEVPCGLYPFKESDAPLFKGEKMGLINQDYEVVVPCRYSEIDRYSEGLCAVESSERWGFVDTKGEEVIPMRYLEVHPFHEGLATVCHTNGRWGVVNALGQSCCAAYFDAIGNYSEGMCWVERNGKTGYINAQGRLVVSYQYLYAEDFRHGVALVSYDGEQWGVINQRGYQIVPCRYPKADIEVFENRVVLTTRHTYTQNGLPIFV